MAGYFLDCIGGLIWSAITPPGGVELTRDQYDGLFLYAPADRAAALACCTAAVAAVALVAAYNECESVKLALANAAAAELSDAAKIDLERMLEAATVAHSAALKAYGDAKEAVEAIAPKLDELRAKLSECPPTRD